MLYRLFPWTASAAPDEPGGPLFNPRRQQGGGRHDQPAAFGALYLSRSDVSTIAEWLAAFRGQGLNEEDFSRTDGRSWAVVGFDEGRLGDLPDLDDPAELDRRRLRPSGVATHRRPVTQRLAADLFAEGAVGFSWWSTLEASWSNVTLFAERALPLLAVAEAPRRMTIDEPLVRAAAAAVGVLLEPAGARARTRRPRPS
jgi:hypothetical protein